MIKKNEKNFQHLKKKFKAFKKSKYKKVWRAKFYKKINNSYVFQAVQSGDLNKKAVL